MGKLTAEQWLGISWDESERMADSKWAWIHSRWPLVELRFTRTHCVRWLNEYGWPIPSRSACIGCPYHTSAEWLQLADAYPEEVEEAAQIEERMIESTGRQQFLHRRTIPLRQAIEADRRGVANTIPGTDSCESGFCFT